MTSSLKQFGRESLIYGFGHVLIRIVTFLLMPLYTNKFTQAEYGTLTLVMTFIGLVQIVYVFGMNNALMKFYTRAEEDRRQVVTTTFLSLFIAAIVFSSCLSLTARPLSQVLFGLNQPLWIHYAAAILVLDTISVRGMVLLRFNNRPMQYILLALVNVTVTMSANILLVLRCSRGVTGAIESTVLAALASFLLVLPIISREFKGSSYSQTLLKRMLWFGLPFVPGAFFQFVMDLADRYLVDWLGSREMVGLYGAGYKIGSIMLILQTGFNLGWLPYFLKKEKDPEAPQLFARIATYFAVGLTGVWVFMVLFADLIVRLRFGSITLIGSEFWTAVEIIPLVMLGYIFLGFYDMLMPGIYYRNKSHLVAIYRGIGAVTNIVLNLLFIPRWGIMGAAWATCLAFALMSCTLYFQTQRLFYIPFRWARILSYLGLATLVYILKIQLHPGGWMLVGIFLVYLAIVIFSLRRDIRNFFRSSSGIKD